MMDWFSANATAVQAFSAAIQAIFAIILTAVGLGQLWVYHKQRQIMEGSREITVASLGRPHVFFEFISHNLESWRNGEADLTFVYRLANYGNSPAIVRSLYGRALLARGPRYRERNDDPTPVHEFPADKFSFLSTIHELGEPNVTADGESESGGFTAGLKQWSSAQQFVVMPGKASRAFAAQLPHDLLVENPERNPARARHNARMYELTGEESVEKVWAWLMGQVTYLGPFEDSHLTNFCVRAYHDGSLYVGGADEEGAPPYNERT